jgi:hypothetical protein
MTALLDPQAADRLAKLLGMLGSHHDGEALTAARKADQCIRQLGLTWGDVIHVSGEHAHDCAGWQHMARACRALAHRLSAREFDFINNIAMARFEPSPKQAAWLRSIYERVGP